jgi:hypothetical protein
MAPPAFAFDGDVAPPLLAWQNSFFNTDPLGAEKPQ